MCFHYFVIISPWKRVGPFIVLFTKKCFVPSLVEIGPVVLEKMKMWKVYANNDGETTDKFCSEKLTRVFGSGGPKSYLEYKKKNFSIELLSTQQLLTVIVSTAVCWRPLERDLLDRRTAVSCRTVAAFLRLGDFLPLEADLPLDLDLDLDVDFLLLLFGV